MKKCGRVGFHYRILNSYFLEKKGKGVAFLSVTHVLQFSGAHVCNFLYDY